MTVRDGDGGGVRTRPKPKFLMKEQNRVFQSVLVQKGRRMVVDFFRFQTNAVTTCEPPPVPLMCFYPTRLRLQTVGIATAIGRSFDTASVVSSSDVQPIRRDRRNYSSD